MMIVMYITMYGRVCLRFYFLNLTHIHTSTPQKADVAISNAIKHQMVNCASFMDSIWFQVRICVAICVYDFCTVPGRSSRTFHTQRPHFINIISDSAAWDCDGRTFHMLCGNITPCSSP